MQHISTYIEIIEYKNNMNFIELILHSYNDIIQTWLIEGKLAVVVKNQCMYQYIYVTNIGLTACTPIQLDIA